MVLGEQFVVSGRIVVPLSSVYSGVCLDLEDDGTSHTATPCPTPKDPNLPTDTFGNLHSPSLYILPSCVIFVTESSAMLCVDTVSVTSVWCTKFFHTNSCTFTYNHVLVF
jgi:hypothetical protein